MSSWDEVSDFKIRLGDPDGEGGASICWDGEEWRKPVEKELLDLEHVRMCLTEVGYDPSLVFLYPIIAMERTSRRLLPTVRTDCDISLAVWWMAYDTCGIEIACWSCWSCGELDQAYECRTGRCKYPNGPRKPPRELLRGGEAVFKVQDS